MPPAVSIEPAIVVEPSVGIMPGKVTFMPPTTNTNKVNEVTVAVIRPGKVLPVWNPPVQPTTVTISRNPSKGVFVLVAATNIALPLSQWQPAYIGFDNSVTLPKQGPVEFFRGI
jgi:hypothetical protein